MKPGRIVWSIAALLPLCAVHAGAPPMAKQPQVVVAGTGPTAILEVVPVNPPEGLCGGHIHFAGCFTGSNIGAPCTTNADCPPMPPYPPGTTIVGNELAADTGGFRAWFEYRVSNWDPAGDGTEPDNPGAVQIQIDGTGLLDADTNQNGDLSDDGDQPDLLLASIPCLTSFTCVSAFGEAWAKCLSGKGLCKVPLDDRSGQHPRSFCADFGFGICDIANCATGSMSNEFCFAITSAPRPDDGIPKHIGMLVLDVPADAKGRYTVNLFTDQTFLCSSTSPPEEIPTAVKRGFTVNILTGRCCFGFGTPAAGCVDGVTRAECGNEPAPVVFTPEANCPPDGSDCERVTGACCNGDPFGPCADDRLISECQCPSCTWYQFETCEEMDCPAASIPTVSAWGLAVLTLLLMIGAKIAFSWIAGEGDVTHND